MSSTHIQKRSTVLLQMCLSVWLFLSVTGQAAAEESFTTTISFYAGFDLTSGMTEIDPTVLTLIIGDGQEIEAIAAPEIDPLFEFSPEIDLYFGFSANAERPLTVIAEQIKGMTVLADTEFEAVTQRMLKTLDIPAVAEVMIDQDDLVVLLTQDNQYVLLGSVQQVPGVQVQLTYQIISGIDPETVPEPGTWLLLGGGLIGIFGKIRRKKLHNRFTGGKWMKYAQTCLLVLFLMPLFVGRVSAAELRIMRIGTGMGKVVMEDFFCSAPCTRTYPENTVVHLKAEPYSGSRFVGWRVNGLPHQGVITITGNTLVQAIFESNAPEESHTIFWYNSKRLKRAILALDEVALFFDVNKLLQLPERSQEDALSFVQDIARQFDPDAEILDVNENEMLLKLPVPLTEEQLGAKLATFTLPEFVLKTGIVAYTEPDKQGIRMISDSNTISVLYVPGITDEDILKIEQEFGLTRVDVSSYGSFTYQAGTHPLEAIEIARRLFESGQVEYAYPLWYKEIDLISSCPNDGWFTKQWHLNQDDQQLFDVNILPAWENNQGNKSVIGIVDTGVDYTHPDLREPYYRPNLSNNFLDDKSNDPFPQKPRWWSWRGIDWETAAHGTNVAGLAMATGHGYDSTEGVCGTAPQAGLAALRVSLLSELGSIPMKPLVEALKYKNSEIDIYNCSWNLTDNNHPRSQLYEDDDIEQALKEGIGVDEHGIDVKGAGGRQGLGNIYVVGTGNELVLLSNDALLNSRFTIPVATTDKTGKWFMSNRGAYILVNAPGSTNTWGEGIVTTGYPDWGYEENFSGTSAAAPIVSGIVALLLQVKPELTWRDVQQILIKTAKRTDKYDSSWNTGGVYPFSHYYGFGLVDAAAVVDATRSWTLVPEEQGIGPYPGSSDRVDVPENLRIEFVEVIFTSPYEPWNGIDIQLLSPYETESILASAAYNTPVGETKTYDEWTFGSIRHFGEYSQGKWKLTAQDIQGNPVEFDWELRIYGTELPTWNLETPTASTCEQAESGGVVCTFADGSGRVLLQPTNVERPDVQYVFLDADDAESTTHSGTYWFPRPQDDAMPQTLTLSTDWRPVLDETGEAASRQQPCDEGPPPSTETFDFPWRVDVVSAGEACDVRFQWNEQPPVILTLQPPAGQTCDVLLPEPSSGVATATVSSEWEPEGPPQQVGQWGMAGEPEIVTEYVYRKSCKMTLHEHEISYPDGSAVWFYTCHVKEPWPPEPPETSCSPSSPPETLTDPENPPSGNVCLSAEVEAFEEFQPYPADTWEDWWACYLPSGHGQHCHLEGGGQYPIRRTMQYTPWVWQTESCEQTYRSDPETVTVSYPSLQDTPPFAGGVSVQLSPRE